MEGGSRSREHRGACPGMWGRDLNEGKRGLWAEPGNVEADGGRGRLGSAWWGGAGDRRGQGQAGSLASSHLAMRSRVEGASGGASNPGRFSHPVELVRLTGHLEK